MMTALTLDKFALLIVLLGLFLLSGCATKPLTGPDTELPLRQYEDVVDTDQEHPMLISDPLEGFNRGVYRFNYYFDKYIFLPIVGAYAFIMPDYAEDRVTNFVDNIYEFNNFTNNLMQLKFKETGITLARFVVNTTVGIAGLWDPATSWDIREQKEDFGQTLGHYGVGHGPYLVLPVFGPSNLRDATGLVADSLTFTNLGPPKWVDKDDVTLVFSAVAAVDVRHRQSFRYYATGSPFEYEMVRMLYSSQRKILIAK